MEGRRRCSDTWDWPMAKNDGVVALKNDSSLFEADLEVPAFKASEIDVKLLNDELIVHCFKDQGPGRTPREIHRSYKLPPDLDLQSLKYVKNDSSLQIVASKKKI